MNTPAAQPGPRPAPRPTPRSRMSSHSSPSAPPAEHHHAAEGGNLMNGDFPNKRQSQAVSPNAFSYAPGLFFPQNQPPNAFAPAPSGPSSRGSTGATAPYPSGNGAHPMAAPLSHPPPDYATSAYPQGEFLCSFMGEFYCHKGWSLHFQFECMISSLRSQNLQCLHSELLLSFKYSFKSLYSCSDFVLSAQILYPWLWYPSGSCWNLPLLSWVSFQQLPHQVPLLVAAVTNWTCCRSSFERMSWLWKL